MQQADFISGDITIPMQLGEGNACEKLMQLLFLDLIKDNGASNQQDRNIYQKSRQISIPSSSTQNR
jgi:hypothetical protein